MKIQNKNSWYTILVTLMIIGFLIVLTTWVLNLVLREMNDNRWAWNYLKAYAWAEGSMELALLKIKKHWYWIYDKLDFWDTSNNDKILRNNLSNDKEILISYDLNSKTKTYSWSLKPFEQSVIPLFYIKPDDSREKINNLNLEILNSFLDDSKMAWNIVSQEWDWIWWNWLIENSTKWKWRKKDWKFLDEIKVSNFLSGYNNNYLIIINLDNTNNLDFKMNSAKEFTKPTSKIISSSSIWNYKQSLETTLDNTAFLSILKYSVYSQ